MAMKCKTCEKWFSGGSTLGQHYREFPDHRVRRKVEPTVAVLTRRIKFCPRCGCDIEKLQLALDLAERMEGSLSGRLESSQGNLLEAPKRVSTKGLSNG